MMFHLFLQKQKERKGKEKKGKGKAMVDKGRSEELKGR